MGITSIKRDWGVDPCIVRIATDSSLSQVEVTGYILDQADNIFLANHGEFQWVSGELVAVQAIDGTGFYKISEDFESLETDETPLPDGVMLTYEPNTLASTSIIRYTKFSGTESGGAVIINSACGNLTTSSLTTAGGASYTIALSNDFSTISSQCYLTWMGGTNTVSNFTYKASCVNGTVTIVIYNNTAATAFDGTIVFGFVLI